MSASGVLYFNLSRNSSDRLIRDQFSKFLNAASPTKPFLFLTNYSSLAAELRVLAKVNNAAHFVDVGNLYEITKSYIQHLDFWKLPDRERPFSGNLIYAHKLASQRVWDSSHLSRRFHFNLIANYGTFRSYIAQKRARQLFENTFPADPFYAEAYAKKVRLSLFQSLSHSLQTDARYQGILEKHPNVESVFELQLKYWELIEGLAYHRLRELGQIDSFDVLMEALYQATFHKMPRYHFVLVDGLPEYHYFEVPLIKYLTQKYAHQVYVVEGYSYLYKKTANPDELYKIELPDQWQDITSGFERRIVNWPNIQMF